MFSLGIITYSHGTFLLTGYHSPKTTKTAACAQLQKPNKSWPSTKCKILATYTPSNTEGGSNREDRLMKTKSLTT